MIIKFERVGCCDELLVTNHNGSEVVISGIGVIDYVINNYKLGDIKKIILKNCMIPINTKEYSNIEQLTKAEVFILNE